MFVLVDLLVATIRPERMSHLGWAERQRGSLKKKNSGVKSHLHVLFRFIVKLSLRLFSLVSIRNSYTRDESSYIQLLQ